MNSRTGDLDLIAPYGESLVDLLVGPSEIDELRTYGSSLPSIQLSDRSVCDLELLALGAFSPLNEFMRKVDFEGVVNGMRLKSGHLFPIPIALSVNPAPEISLDRDIAVRNSKNELLAIMTIEEVYEWNREEVARNVFRTTDVRHPLIAEMDSWGKINISGRIRVLQLPRHYDFQNIRLSPRMTRKKLQCLGCANVVAFQTRNPLHRAHEELTKRALNETNGVLLLHPVVGMTKPGDVDHYTRVRTYKALENYYESDRILLSLLPLAMRMAGPREALWHALIRRNYGANHLIVGRDHASPGLDSNGNGFYGPYEAQDLVKEHEKELGVRVIPFQEMVYLSEERRYEETAKVRSNTAVSSLSGSQVRDHYLSNGHRLPEWFTRPEVGDILAESFPPRHRQGVCLWFTGLSGSGKSTTAEIVTVLLLESGRQVTVLDGDVVRTHLSDGLGFTKADRDTNIRRIGFVAAEIVRHGGVVICAAVSPYRAARNDVRNLVGGHRFVEVFVDTPLETCEMRDTKGLYAKARRGEIPAFTGISDLYEAPEHPEITLYTLDRLPEQNAKIVFEYLEEKGYVRSDTKEISIPLEF